jgi:rod shape-determining protein MreC
VLSGRRALIKGRALCRMDFINKDAEVRVGDEVETSGMGGIFPRSIMVGRVSKIYRDDTGLYQCADIVPAVDLSNLDIVFLIESYQPPPTANPDAGGGL